MILFLKSFIISVRNNFYFFIEFSLDIFFAITCNNSSLRTEKRQQKIIKDFIVKFLFYDAITSFNFFLPFFIAYFLYICNNPIYIISYWLAARFPKKLFKVLLGPLNLKWISLERCQINFQRFVWNFMCQKKPFWSMMVKCKINCCEIPFYNRLALDTCVYLIWDLIANN